jgi:CO/xanthine dehydrogenase Mo-binding subunit
LGTIRISNRVAIGVPTGPWRGVTNVSEAFAHESYFDELAHGLGLDPVEARMGVLDERAARVVRAAAETASWNAPLPEGWGRGIAQHATWGLSPMALVAEVLIEAGTIAVQRIVCAIDCGLVVNPDTVRAQIEGGVVFGLSAALLDGIHIDGGAVRNTNYHDYRVLRFSEMPIVEVVVVDSDEDPTGVGEMAVAPVAPGIANAVFDAVGVRLRSLPLRLPS